jgi:hypothetical protein
VAIAIDTANFCCREPSIISPSHNFHYLQQTWEKILQYCHRVNSETSALLTIGTACYPAVILTAKNKDTFSQNVQERKKYNFLPKINHFHHNGTLQ